MSSELVIKKDKPGTKDLLRYWGRVLAVLVGVCLPVYMAYAGGDPADPLASWPTVSNQELAKLRGGYAFTINTPNGPEEFIIQGSQLLTQNGVIEVEKSLNLSANTLTVIQNNLDAQLIKQLTVLNVNVYHLPQFQTNSALGQAIGQGLIQSLHY